MAHKNPRTALTGFLFFILAISVGVFSLVWRQRVPGVEAAFESVPRYVGAQTHLTLNCSASRGGVREIRVELLQGDRQVELSSHVFNGSEANQRIELELDAAGLQLTEDEALLLVYATDGFWRLRPVDGKAALKLPIMVDLTAPILSVSAATRYPDMGGAGIAVMRSERDATLRVVAEDESYPAFASQDDPAKYLSLFPVAYNHPASTQLFAVARDEAGNESRQALPIRIREKKFKHGQVNIPKDFVARKIPELLPDRSGIDESEYADAFLVLNRDMRADAARFKRQMGARSAGRILWSDAFIQPPNTRVFSNFAETRSYRIDGKSVDEQVHLGFDLASVKNAPVPAANAGHVVFAGSLGIYGNAVILDHGLGLQTLYAHFSELRVSEGQDLAKGETVGLTGTTGLAVGDHLHYEVMIHGIPVNPLQWWDQRWIRDHIAQPLLDAGLPAPSAR